MHCCFPHQGMRPGEHTRYYPAVGPAIPRRWVRSSRVTHPSATEPELPPAPFDLHVLGTPPAFVLSQDQTLRRDRPPAGKPVGIESVGTSVRVATLHGRRIHGWVSADARH